MRYSLPMAVRRYRRPPSVVLKSSLLRICRRRSRNELFHSVLAYAKGSLSLEPVGARGVRTAGPPQMFAGAIIISGHALGHGFRDGKLTHFAMRILPFSRDPFSIDRPQQDIYRVHHAYDHSRLSHLGSNRDGPMEHSCSCSDSAFCKKCRLWISLTGPVVLLPLLTVGTGPLTVESRPLLFCCLCLRPPSSRLQRLACRSRPGVLSSKIPLSFPVLS